jgi:hypothetical protein
MKTDNDLDNNDMSTPKKVQKNQQPESNITPTKGKRDNRSNVPKKDDDGDEYDAENSYRGYGKSFPPSSTLYEKMSKENAAYQQGAPFENCGKCNYYSAGHCKIVRGYIVPSMVCKYFSEKYSSISISVIKRK